VSGDGGFGVRRGAALAVDVVDVPAALVATAFFAGAGGAAFLAVAFVAVVFVGDGVVSADLFMEVVDAFVARAFVVVDVLDAADFRAGAVAFLAAGAAARFAAGAAFFAGALVGAARLDVADFFDGAGFGFFDAAIRASFPACERRTLAGGSHDRPTTATERARQGRGTTAAPVSPPGAR
jgi:hypothetical protein